MAWSVGAALAGGTMVLEGGRAVPARLDLAVAFMPQGWPTLVALLWAPLVVFAGGVPGRGAPEREGGGAPGVGDGALLAWGAALMAAGLLAGVALGSLGSLAGEGGLTVGSPAVVPALLATMLVLYLFASALILATGRFWLPLVAVVLFLAGVRWVAVATGWAPFRWLQEWITLGRFGPGTMMESPARVAGVVLESPWVGLSPWPGLLVWLGVAAAAAPAGVRWGRGRRQPPPSVASLS